MVSKKKQRRANDRLSQGKARRSSKIPPTRVLPSARLTLKDKLSRLTFIEACKLLGPEGKSLIQRNANGWEFKIERDVYLGDDLFRLSFPGEFSDGQPLTVTITLMSEARQRLHWNCTRCETACEHVGAAFSMILEDKSALGLAIAPQPRKVVEGLAETDLVKLALSERAQRSREEKMTVKSQDAAKPWTDYLVTNKGSGKSYRVALRGLECGECFCTCPIFARTPWEPASMRCG